MLDITIPEAGIHLVIWLPEGMSGQVAAQQAARYGLDIMPISSSRSSVPVRGGLMLAYSNASPDELRAGTKRLAQVLRAL